MSPETLRCPSRETRSSPGRRSFLRLRPASRSVFRSSLRSFGLILLIGMSLSLITAACGGDPELLAIENLTDGPLTVEITEVPDDQPLETGASRTANVPVDTMYQTELVEITDDTSARIRVSGPNGAALCEYVATESEPAPRLVVLADGCVVEADGP
jgi:hypothetical protein